MSTLEPVRRLQDEPRIQNRAWSEADILAALDAYDTATYSYDDNGDQILKSIGDATWNYRYDAQRRLIQVLANGASSARFVYDGDGGRVQKITPSGTTLYIGNLYEEGQDGSHTDHVYANGQLICDLWSLGVSTETYYYSADHLGSTSLVTDSRGNLKQEIHYEPFGDIFSSSGTSPVHRKYTGQENDSETGLDFYQARYYDPSLGRFISQDSIVPSAMDPQSLNRYAYVKNNPIILTDPSGHSVFSTIVKSELPEIAIAAAVVISVAAPETAPMWGMIIGASAGAAQAAINGGNAGDDFSAAMMGGISGGAAGAAGGAAGGVGSGIGSVIIGGAAGGAVGAGSSAVMMGADPRTAWRLTYQGAGWGATEAAAMYAIFSTNGNSKNVPGRGQLADAGDGDYISQAEQAAARYGKYIPFTEVGEESAEWYADRYNETGNELYWIGGIAASAWTPETAPFTIMTLSGAEAASGWAAETGPGLIIDGPAERGGRIFQIRNLQSEEPVFRIDYHSISPGESDTLHYHRWPDMSVHRPYEGW